MGVSPHAPVLKEDGGPQWTRELVQLKGTQRGGGLREWDPSSGGEMVVVS